MKKFLRLFAPNENLEISSALDQRILAVAALRAKRFRARRRQLRIYIPSAAAAAVIAVAGVSFWMNMPSKTPNTTKSISQGADMLALADMTSLEQSNYNTSLALAEVDLPEDVLFM